MNAIQTFNNEFGYVCYKYFSNSKIEPNYDYRNFILYLNNLPYEYYRFLYGVEVMIPSYDYVLDGDFEDIYILTANEPISFTIRVINRKDSIVRTKDYNYNYSKGKAFTSFAYNEIDDKNEDFKNLFKKSGLPLEQFVIQNYFEDIKKSNSMICSAVNYNDNYSCFITSFAYCKECVKEIDQAIKNHKYEQIDQDKKYIMEMNEQLIINKLKNKVKKIK